MERIKTTIEELFKLDRQLLGPGYDSALEYLSMLIGLKITSIPSGTQFGTWTVPEEWVAKEAWVKYKGKKIIDFSKEPLSLVVYSIPFQGKISKEELLKHLHCSESLPDATPYVFKFYDRDWGFCLPKTKLDKLKDGEYEVFIDTEFKPGNLKYGVHTIKGESEREILFFAHLDHPHQANDNLSAVACLVELSKRLKCKHTVKIIFCPETIGSQAYAYQEDLSRVDMVMAVDICGNDNSLLLQKSWANGCREDHVAHCALQMMGKQYRKGKFRTVIGSDETVFNDPLIGIPGLMLSRYPYKEYHTNLDTPEIIKYEEIEGTIEFILKFVEIYEKDYIPVRNFKGPLMRSRYGMQATKEINLVWDYCIYSMDGERYLSDICADGAMPFDEVYRELEKIVADGQITKCGTQ